MRLGDEPKQYISKFPNITVAVDEQRRRGIKQLLKLQKPPEIILLDDAFQHRYVKPGLNILLTDYHNLYTKDYLFRQEDFATLNLRLKEQILLLSQKRLRFFHLLLSKIF
jgi:tetraacyldisaccharide-1-P 4'-kinase